MASRSQRRTFRARDAASLTVRYVKKGPFLRMALFFHPKTLTDACLFGSRCLRLITCGTLVALTKLKRDLLICDHGFRKTIRAGY